MPAHRGQNGSNWLDAADLVGKTPTVPEISERAVWMICCVISMTAVAILADVTTWFLLILAIPAVWAAKFSAQRIDSPRIGNFIFARWTIRRAEKFSAWEASAGNTKTVRGIMAGDWVCHRSDYDQAKQNYRAINGRSSSPPPARYRFVVATFPLDGSSQAVAFADGTAITWHSSSSVHFIDDPQLGGMRIYGSDHETLEVAKALNDIAGFLYRIPQPVTVKRTVELLGTGDDTVVFRALMVAEWWKLVSWTCLASNPKDTQAYYDPSHLVIQLTEAGKRWYLASSGNQFVLQKGSARSMQGNSSNQPSINIGNFSGILNYAGKNISGSHTANNSGVQPADDEVLSWLRTVLGLAEIPWSNPDLTVIRYTIEQALTQRNPRMSGLKQAIVKLGNICQQIAIGVAGNATYAMLLQHFK